MISTLLLQSLISATITFSWNANTETDLKGYKIYQGTVSKVYATSVDVGNVTTYKLSNVPSGVPLFFAVTAYNTQGLESDFSNEITARVPSAPSNLKISGNLLTMNIGEAGGFALQTSNDLNNWGTLSAFTTTGPQDKNVFVSKNQSKQFFRVTEDIQPPLPPSITKALVRQPLRHFKSVNTRKGAELLIKRGF
jgi:hypothetical protein